MKNILPDRNTVSEEEYQFQLDTLNNDPFIQHNFNQPGSVSGGVPAEFQSCFFKIKQLLLNPALNDMVKQEQALQMYESFYTLSINRIRDFKVGNCAENAFFVAKHLECLNVNLLVLDLTPKKDIFNPVSQSTHTICLINVKDLSIELEDNDFIGKKDQWGEDFIIVDAWSKDTYTYTELKEKISLSNGSFDSQLKAFTRSAVENALESGNISVIYARAKKNLEARVLPLVTG